MSCLWYFLFILVGLPMLSLSIGLSIFILREGIKGGDKDLTMKVTYVYNEVCMYSDDEIIWRALRSRCSALERVLERQNMTLIERRKLQDEYERTFSLTEKFSKR